MAMAIATGCPGCRAWTSTSRPSGKDAVTSAWGPITLAVGDIEVVSFPRADWLVCCETLEHLADPWRFVTRARAFVRERYPRRVAATRDCERCAPRHEPQPAGRLGAVRYATAPGHRCRRPLTWVSRSATLEA